MGTKVGLWIDHRKAIVVTVTDKGEEMGLIVSTVQKQLRRSGDSPLKGPYEQQQVPADDSRQRTLTGHLNIYYDAVIACIGDAESILIFALCLTRTKYQNGFCITNARNHRIVVNVEMSRKGSLSPMICRYLLFFIG